MEEREGLDMTDLKIFDVADEEEPNGNPGPLERRDERSPRLRLQIKHARSRTNGDTILCDPTHPFILSRCLIRTI